MTEMTDGRQQGRGETTSGPFTDGEMMTVESDGFALAVRRYGDGVPFVFLHGAGSDSRDSRSNLGQLAGLDLILPDQRGHGLSSPAPIAEQFKLSDLVGDLQNIVALLSLNRPIIGGGSMGAGVAMRYALDDPLRCRALVLVVPALGAEPPRAAPALLAVADRIESVGLATVVAELRTVMSTQGTDPEGGDGLDAWLRQDPRSLVVTLRSVCQWQPLTDLGELAQVPIPVAIVAVRDDFLHPVEVAKSFHAHFPNSALEVLDSPAEAQCPGAVGAAVARQLDQLGVTGVTE